MGVDLGFAEGSRVGSKGLSGQRQVELNRAPALFVQRAVRHQALTAEHDLFVQEAVRASSLESLARSVRVDSMNSSAAGVATLFDPFALGAPAVAQERAALEKAEQGQRTSGVATKDFLTPPEQPPLRPSMAVKPVQAPPAAEGFSAQVQRSAKSFRARVPPAPGTEVGRVRMPR